MTYLWKKTRQKRQRQPEKDMNRPVTDSSDEEEKYTYHHDLQSRIPCYRLGGASATRTCHATAEPSKSDYALCNSQWILSSCLTRRQLPQFVISAQTIRLAHLYTFWDCKNVALESLVLETNLYNFVKNTKGWHTVFPYYFTSKWYVNSSTDVPT